jgi:hypothetical protein
MSAAFPLAVNALYNDTTLNNDVALVFLSQCAALSDSVATIKIASKAGARTQRAAAGPPAGA